MGELAGFLPPGTAAATERRLLERWGLPHDPAPADPAADLRRVHREASLELVHLTAEGAARADVAVHRGGPADRPRLERRATEAARKARRARREAVRDGIEPEAVDAAAADGDREGRSA